MAFVGPTLPALAINRQKFRLPEDQYFHQVQKKNLCVLHFTAAPTADGSYQWWKGNLERVAAAFLLDADGTIYEVFQPDCWAYHLGIKGTWAHDKRSIGIEIANVGPLKRRGNELCWWPDNFTRHYCDADETDKYIETAPWRGYSAWATYSPAQLAVLPELVKKVCSDHEIPRKLLPKGQRMSNIGHLKDVTGIIAHHNARSAKSDVGPAFPWEILS